MKRRIGLMARATARGEEGVAIITVLMVVMIMTLLGTTMVANLTSELNQVGRQRRVTTARAAADAGVDRIVFHIQQENNWEDMVTQYNTASGNWWGDPANGDWWKIGEGRFRAHVDCDAFDCGAGDPSQRVATVEGEFPSGSGVSRKIEVTLRRSAPEALTRFAMFADRQIDIHHHGSSFVSPQMVTTEVHSNGGIKIDYTSSFYVDTISAVGSLELGRGGSNPGDATGYNWAYWISQGDTQNSPRCYPPKVFPPKTIANSDSSFSTYWNAPLGTSCAGNPKYSPNARVIGNAFGNSVTVESQGSTSASDSGSTCVGTTQAGINNPLTGSCIPDRPGDVHGHLVKVGGSNYTGVPAGNEVVVHYRAGTEPPPCSGSNCVADCPNCNQGTADQGGRAGGSVYSHPAGWAPAPIEFPGLNYEEYHQKARAEQGGGGCSTGQKTCHVFPNDSGDGFIQYLADPASVTGSYSTSGCKTCVYWLDAGRNDTTDPTRVAYVVARGTYFLDGEDIDINWGDIRSQFGTDSTEPTPVIMIQGALLSRGGGASLKSSLTVVGQTMDPFRPLDPYPADTVPGLLAATKGMSGSDYDADSNWDDPGRYEPLKRNALTVRGLVYAGEYDPATGTTTAGDFHFHNYDPKNSTTIIGAEVGGKLHNCNSFIFSYDPLVQNLTGFESGEAGGGVFVVDWQEV